MAISGTGRGQRSRSARTHVERPERENLGVGGRGVREGGEDARAAALAAAETGSPALRSSVRLSARRVRVATGQVEDAPRRRQAGGRRGWAAGRRRSRHS